ncbi:MAG: class I adenylate cyclase [Deltaproteobacteria bacterium]|nr:class I adenylate cyclase [Deltaproteobacteria bacterium]
MVDPATQQNHGARDEAAVPTPAPLSLSAAAEAISAYNAYRRARLESQAGEKARDALNLLPLLLHLNQPGLPGYVDDPQCPAGVSQYAPGPAEYRLARRLFPQVETRRTGVLRHAIELVAVMGSVGTIGFSGESDLDIWICHRPGRLPGLGRFREKLQAVEAWMNDFSGIEVHLFLVDPERVRENDFGEADLEGCGSAMGALLKEEFYRTGILLAGKLPVWWLMPPGATAQESARRLSEIAASDTQACLDLGSVPRVPLGELFGAAIWQIVKSWKSPFKSALKMGLLERAVRTRGEAPPLCDALKALVYAGEKPDPYRLLFDEVLAYYRGTGDAEAEDLLARCFYLKAGTRIDPERTGPAAVSEDQAVLSEYVRTWGWGSRRLRHLNAFGEWKFEWVQALAKEIDRFSVRAYQRIRAILDESGETQRITSRDLTVLGRKLQIAYRRAAHKVEATRWVSHGVGESSLSLYQEVLPTGEAPWMLFRGIVNAFNLDESGGDLLRSSGDPLELLVWAAQNKLLTQRTRVIAKGIGREVPAADLECLTQLLASHVAAAEREEVTTRALLEKPLPLRLSLIPNFLERKDEVREVGALWSTTWGETFYRHWQGPEALRGFMEELLVPFVEQAPRPDELSIFVPARKIGAMKGPHWRLQRELPGLASFLGGPCTPEVRRRHLGAAEHGYFVLDRQATSTQYRPFPDRDALLRYLSGVGPYRTVDTRVENCAGDLAVLKTVFETAQPGAVDVFILEETDRETFFIVDEIGNLIHFVHSPEGQPYALARLLRFLEETLPAVCAQPETPLRGRGVSDAVRIHTLVYEGNCRALPSTADFVARVRALGLNPVGLTIERLAAKGAQGSGYVITWGDQVIRSGDVANPLEEVRRRIRRARSSGLEYEIFLTRLFLDERFVANNCGPFVATGHYLFYKKAIEQRLSS